MRRAAAIWDMDGVLVDSGEAHYEAWRAVAAGRGLALSRAQFLPTFGMNNPDAIRALFGELPPGEAQRIAADKEERFRGLLRGRARALPGARQLVRALEARGHLQAVASSAPRANLELLLEELELSGCFQGIASGDEIRRGKPDPEIFLLAASRLRSPPAEAIVLEDAVVGVLGGKRAGMRVYAVTSTRRREELAAADRVVDSLEELSADDFLLA